MNADALFVKNSAAYFFSGTFKKINNSIKLVNNELNNYFSKFYLTVGSPKCQCQVKLSV